jgi:hypothetical protein
MVTYGGFLHNLSFISCDYGSFISKSLDKQHLRHKAVRAATFLGHPRPLLGIAFQFHRSFQTFSCWERCSVFTVFCIFKFLCTAPLPHTSGSIFWSVQCNRSSRYFTFSSSRYFTFSNLKGQQRPLRGIIWIQVPLTFVGKLSALAWYVIKG